MAHELLISTMQRRDGDLIGEVTKFMQEELLFSKHFLWDGKCYMVHVYRRSLAKERGSHMAETLLGPDDRVISDGGSPQEVLIKQQAILPVAIFSRALL